MPKSVRNKGKQPPKPANENNNNINNNNHNNNNNNNINIQLQTRARKTHADSKDLSQFEDEITESRKILLDVPEKATRFMKRTPQGTKGYYCRNMISITMAKPSSPMSVVRSNHVPYKECIVRNDRLLFYKAKAKGKKDAKDQRRKKNALEFKHLENKEKAAIAKRIKLIQDNNVLKARENEIMKKELDKRESQL